MRGPRALPLTVYVMTKPRLSFWQIWNMSFGFLGIQFGFALQNANVSRIFETLGASVDEIPILWIAAPVTGLLVQPVIGHMSDRTWNRLGRRRPYFLVGALLASAALVVMPNAPVLWVAAGMLWVMDASINVAMEPFRAFVGDMLPSEQRTTGFAMQSFFIGAGAVVASALPYVLTNGFGVANTAGPGEIPDSVKWSFYKGGAVFLLVVNVFLFIVGMFVETSASIIVLAPILAPVAMHFGIDPVHFGLIMVVNLAMGMITPPFGVNLFAACQVAGLSLEQIIGRLIPFVLVVFACLMVITYVPAVTLFFRSLVY